MRHIFSVLTVLHTDKNAFAATKRVRLYHHNLTLKLVIPLGFEPKTHALEGRCSNPTELRNRKTNANLHYLADLAKY